MKRIDQIRKVCASWHGGQWSALYQFASSGIFIHDNILRYLRELQECREPEYYLYPCTISKHDDLKLSACQRWFEKQYGSKIVWEHHPIYGYMVPCLAEHDDTVTKLILAI